MSETRRRSLIGVALSVGLIAAADAPRAQDSAASAPAAEEPMPTFDAAFMANPRNIKVGETVWQEQCRHCHGNSAYPGKGPKLRPSAYTPEFVYDRVTYGFRAMPPWKAVFTIEQRKGIVAYIKSDRFSP